MSRIWVKRDKTPEQLLFRAFDTLDIDKNKKTVLHDRYLKVLENFHFRAIALSYYYYLTRVIVTVGSILVPAFLSIQGTSGNATIYWTTWNISVAVTICNGFMTLFKLDKKYYFINTTLELLHSEGWQYVGLSGRYGTKEGGIVSTHDNQFIHFFKMAEKIKIRQVEEEFWKSSDTSSTNTTNAPLITSSTPATQMGDLASLSNDKKVLIESWLYDMKKNPKVGLQPRDSLSIRRQDTSLDIPILDEGTGPSTLSRYVSVSRMPVQPRVQKSPTREETVLSDSQKPKDEIPEDTIVKLVSDESDVRL